MFLAQKSGKMLNNQGTMSIASSLMRAYSKFCRLYLHDILIRRLLPDPRE